LPLPRWLSHPASHVLRRVFSWFRWLDRRDPAVLRWLPGRLKKKAVQLVWRPLAYRLSDVVALGDLKMQVPQAMRYMYVVRDYEKPTRQLLDRLLEPGMVAVDVGANIGFLTAWMARRIAPAGRVWALEPEPGNLALLGGNLRRNQLEGRVTILAMAAGAENATLPLRLHGRGTRHSLHGQVGVEGTVDVPIRRLDDVVDGRVDVVKIDTEGHELEVLEGMPRILAMEGLHLIVEWCPDFLLRAGRDPAELPRRLAACGLSMELIAECPGPGGLEEAIERVSAGELPRGWYGNLHAWRGAGRWP
jgi:FkbM family methyltransferase